MVTHCRSARFPLAEGWRGEKPEPWEEMIPRVQARQLCLTEV